jgi:hypothetical protein
LYILASHCQEGQESNVFDITNVLNESESEIIGGKKRNIKKRKKTRKVKKYKSRKNKSRKNKSRKNKSKKKYN